MHFRSTILLAALLLPAFSAHAANPSPATQPTAHASTQPTAIDASDAAALEAATGKSATVTGTIDKAAWSKSGKVMRITFKDADASKFEAVVFSKNKEALDKKFKDDAAANLPGAKVRITGTISAYAPPSNPDQKHPQIVLQNLKQIELADTDKK